MVRNEEAARQLTFGDAEGRGKRKQTRREIFLAGREGIVPWKRLLAMTERYYPVSGRRGLLALAQIPSVTERQLHR
ncbi:hypothetical protein BXO25_02630 [Xanthomonas oryzae pv. oryzae]|nr:hypothetical protein BXO25_02630 [Xanthomonas oryzae pv. oryzae]